MFSLSFPATPAGAAAAAQPLEGVVQRAACRHQAEAAGERVADPPEPGGQPGAWLAPGPRCHRCHPQRPGVSAVSV